MLQINFLQISPERFSRFEFETFLPLFKLMIKNRHRLFDDECFRGETPCLQRVYDIISEFLPYFWIFYKKGENSLPMRDYVLNEKNILGFCYLYDLIRHKSRIYSAFASICFEKSAYGNCALNSAKSLLNCLFSDLKIAKIKAECYSTNFLAVNFVKKLGFQLEGEFKNETIVAGKPTDTKIFGILNPNLTVN